MKCYPYVDMTRANAKGLFSTYIIVKTSKGRFFVNTGIETCDRLDGRVFSHTDKSWRQKTTLLGKYIADTECVCMEMALQNISNKKLKDEIRRRVFDLEPKKAIVTLADCIEACAATKREQTAKLYLQTAKRVREFSCNKKLDEVDAAWLERFRQQRLKDGVTINGVGMQLRNIRSVFNWARRQELTTNYPFLDYSIAVEETVPNNISVEQLRALRDYKCEPWQERYRDFFMLSFYLAGMNPVDLLNCRMDAVKDGHLTFIRQKTNKQGQRKVRRIVLPVISEAQEILDRYKSGEGWLLSFMDGRTDYHSFMKDCNEALKKIGPQNLTADKLGRMRKIEYHPILPDITLYTARYTFGSIAANDLDISERTIGMCLGHSWVSRQVTSRYISHDQRKIDEAVRKVADFVNGY